MTKEELIKEAWGNQYSNDVIMEGRRCGFKIIDNIEYIFEYKGGDWYSEPHTCETTAFMPTTLRQILKNNGWIKIESEDDLPKEYDTRLYRLWLWTNNGFYEMQDYKRWKLHYENLKITHYQLKPIVKTKPPIY